METKVVILSIPKNVFSEILTKPELEYLDYLVHLWNWSEAGPYKYHVFNNFPERLADQLQKHSLEHTFTFVTL